MPLFSNQLMLFAVLASGFIFHALLPDLPTAPPPTFAHNCTPGIFVELKPLHPPQDVDGDDLTENGAETLFAIDLVLIETPADTAGFTYSVNREGEAADPEKDRIILTCNDPASVLLEVWRWDADGQGESCTTYALLGDNLIVHCRNPFDPIVGLVTTEEGEGVANVSITNSDESVISTGEDGLYFFNYWEYDSFTLSPRLDTLPLNGVTTFDLVLISKYILGLEDLDSPYKLLAADVNRSGDISIMDLIELRRLILNINDRFENNTSWRFVPADFQFPDDVDPLKVTLPEVISVNDTGSGLGSLDFIAVKVGDVSGDAKGNP